MSSLFSTSWYRVSELCPRLRAHARIQRHVYRGHPWYVLEDVVNQRVHRFSPATYSVIGLMDGEHTVHQIWETATETLGDDGPSQDEVIRLLAQLNSADVLQCDVPPDTADLLERIVKRERQELRGQLLNPFAIRIPLFDPDRWLRRTAPLLKPVMGWLGLALWLAIVLPALFMLGSEWTELTEGIIDKVLAPQNLLLIWLLFPVIKVLHELGHGFATRYFGGEVHDMGVMLLVFTPVPYVDASSASAFPARYQRGLVAGAGMIVEVALAAFAFYVWSAAEPGLVRTLAYNTMLIGGITTLTFNANPLLRFDGYYILSDWLGIPNLRQRSNAYVGYLLERYAFGSRDAKAPQAVGTEGAWLVSYSLAAFAYRMVVVMFILMFLLDISLVVGVILGLMSALGWLFMPLFKVTQQLFSPRLRSVRRRALTVVGGFLVLLIVLIFLTPLPFRTQAEGVVWLPEEAMVRAATSGFVQQVIARPGSRVEAGDPLIACQDPDIESRVTVLEARLTSLRANYRKAQVEDQVRAKLLAQAIPHLEEGLAQARERQADLLVHSDTAGTFVVVRPQDLKGRFFRQGDLLAYVVEPDALRVRAVVPHEDLQLVTGDLTGIEIRRVEQMDEVLTGRLTRLDPGANTLLPSAALGNTGGGSVVVDPRDTRGTTTLGAFFQVELEADLPPDAQTAGGRVYVRFDHGKRSLASRWYRSVRQLFLSRFDV